MQGIRKKTDIDKLLLLLVVLMVARFSCIVLSNIPLMSMSFVFIYGCLFSVLFVLGKRYFKKREFVIFLFLVVYVADVGIITVTSTGSFFNAQAFNAYVMFFLYLIYMFIKRVKHRSAKMIFGITIAGFLFTYIYSIIKLIQNPMLSRIAATGANSEDGIDSLEAIGGFDTVYGSILVVCILLFVMKQTNKISMKLLSFLIIAIGCIFLIMSSYGTALVLLALLFVLWIFQKNRWMGLGVLVVGILFFTFRVHIGFGISKFSEYITYSTTLSQKIDQIGEILQTGQSAGSLAGDDGRLARMGWSWNAFTTHPIFGGFGKSDVQIGAHSELFDTLGRFGIIGAASLFAFIGMLFRDIYLRMKTSEGKKCCSICLVIYIAIMILNPALYIQQILPIFVLLPICEVYCREKDIT